MPFFEFKEFLFPRQERGERSEREVFFENLEIRYIVVIKFARTLPRFAKQCSEQPLPLLGPASCQ